MQYTNEINLLITQGQLEFLLLAGAMAAGKGVEGGGVALFNRITSRITMRRFMRGEFLYDWQAIFNSLIIWGLAKISYFCNSRLYQIGAEH